jgi:hypothetical protein
MLRAPQVIPALLMMALSPAALAQRSTGHMELRRACRWFARHATVRSNAAASGSTAYRFRFYAERRLRT